MFYAKLNNGVIQFAPEYIEKNGIHTFGYNLESNRNMLLEDGYKPVTYEDYPQDGKEYKVVYKETPTTIVGEYKEVIRTLNEIDALRESAYRERTDGLEAELAYKTRKGYSEETLKAIEEKIEEIREQIRLEYPKEGAVEACINGVE